MRERDEKQWEKGKRKDSSRRRQRSACAAVLCGVGAPPEPSFEAGQISAVEGSPKPLLSF